MLVSEETGALQAMFICCLYLSGELKCTGSAWAFPIPEIWHPRNLGTPIQKYPIYIYIGYL